MDECNVWSLLKGREVLVVGHGLAGAAAHLWTVQSLGMLSWPALCRSFHSVALGPCLPADAVLSTSVDGVCGVGEASHELIAASMLVFALAFGRASCPCAAFKGCATLMVTDGN
jgi:hypothetical protein